MVNLQSDATLDRNPSLYVHNAGLLRKTGGAGTFTFDTTTFLNTGTVDVQSGMSAAL